MTRVQVSYPSTNPGHFAELPVEKVKKIYLGFAFLLSIQSLGISYRNMKNYVHT